MNRIEKGGYVYESEDGVNWTSYPTPARETETIRMKAKVAGLPVRASDYRIRTYRGTKSLIHVEHLKQYIEKFSTLYHSTHLYLWGPKGTQKTTIASWVARELLKQDKYVRFIMMDQLLKLLTSFDDNKVKLQELSDCDFLVIDEAFDLSQITVYASGYQIPFLNTFLKDRMEIKGLATCFTSNVPIRDSELKRREDDGTWVVYKALSGIDPKFGLTNFLQRTIPEPMYFEDHFTTVGERIQWDD